MWLSYKRFYFLHHEDGYTCLGWATSKEEAAAKQVRYFLISTEYLDIDSDITLYAVWDKNYFTDVNPKGWAGKYIAYINYRKVMTGFSKTEFGVNNNLIRADMVTLLYKLEGKPAPESSKSPFEDVENGKYYTEPICWAQEKQHRKRQDRYHLLPHRMHFPPGFRAHPLPLRRHLQRL